MVSGAAARAYVDYGGMVEQDALRRREAHARAVFGDEVEVLFNQTHQGLDGTGRVSSAATV